ncbi:hypothetical protein [Butyrivibrio sp. INlla16]|uniref:hypothetical protein n=1 Tax=Butyrivibrio sp. INlla16 TaxID=1520807 RepID=UPI00089206A2|nr:hypothetical protein [Butyrivibrio sp. INlla16]SDB69818.1 hypothetical protein SAMN02910263_04532 [Butyrivibrio sp. INlla16]
MDDFSRNCQELEKYLRNTSFNYKEEMAEATKNCSSKLDVYDLIFGLLFGTLGAVLDTNDKIKDFLDKIHEVSNSDNPSDKNKIIDLFSKILKHKGDWMDQVPVIQEDGRVVSKFVNRNAQEVSKYIWKGSANTPHRIFWGHDIFSLSQDNPFFLEIKQYGFAEGVLQAVRHILADTCSKQGLPIPTSSWWDKVDGDKRTNGLLDYCQRYADDVLGKKQGGGNNEVFNQLFSIHMQDVLANGFACASVAAYCKARNISDEERKQQIVITALAANFLGSAILGAVDKGIPHINWICLFYLTQSTYKLIKASNKNIDILWCKTEELVAESNRLNESVIKKQRETEQDIKYLLSQPDLREKKRSSLMDSFERSQS